MSKEWRLALASALALTMTACDNNNNNGTADAGTDSNVNTDAGTDSNVKTDAGSDSNVNTDAGSDSATDGGVCGAIEISTLRNGQQITPNPQYGIQPTVRGLVTTVLGGEREDRIEVKLDFPTTPGTYSFVDNTQWLTCHQCARILVDIDPATGNYAKAYIATGGQISITAGNSAQQFSGTLVGVQFSETTFRQLNAPYGINDLVPNGGCLTLPTATFDSNVEDGCNPLGANTCTNGRTCKGVNRGGSDGICVGSTGTKVQGETCTAQTNGDSDCAAGYVCDGVCQKNCDWRAANDGCPSGTFCAEFNRCWTHDAYFGAEDAPVDTANIGQPCVVSEVVEGETVDSVRCNANGAPAYCSAANEQGVRTCEAADDTANLGETCTVAGSFFCNASGAFGICATGDAPDTAPRICYPGARAQSECGAGQWLGYRGSARDRSFGWCYTPVTAPTP